MFSVFFLNLIQFDAKLARVQTKAKSYPDSTVSPHSIYKRVCEFFFHDSCSKKFLMCFHKSYIYLAVFLKIYLSHYEKDIKFLIIFVSHFQFKLVNLSSKLKH